ncbi:hypothetical protein THAOC_36974 [Thalassiosira oceanica]|uniref:Uncharacterized protein n=1 Tax=Thalassiosira oceanica TaxID=159749 RepID=K0QZC4_THAOC|nr:hypothetical protein THAOC_36974 [Thalassiosira oceanica]|eukprot:EJK44480.1 hypothetical protein THAOC_36974 [Thalassiosira oceanica]
MRKAVLVGEAGGWVEIAACLLLLVGFVRGVVPAPRTGSQGVGSGARRPTPRPPDASRRGMEADLLLCSALPAPRRLSPSTAGAVLPNFREERIHPKLTKGPKLSNSGSKPAASQQQSRPQRGSRQQSSASASSHHCHRGRQRKEGADVVGVEEAWGLTRSRWWEEDWSHSHGRRRRPKVTAASRGDRRSSRRGRSRRRIKTAAQERADDIVRGPPRLSIAPGRAGPPPSASGGRSRSPSAVEASPPPAPLLRPGAGRRTTTRRREPLLGGSIERRE